VLSSILPPRGSLRRDLLASTTDALAFSVMVGCGETYFAAFALALGLGPVSAGIVATVPILVSALVQLAAPLAVARLRSNRRWVVACTTVQSLCFVPLVWWAIRGHATLGELLIAAAVYWSAGMAGVSAWTTWMAALVPEQIRTSYFAQRNRLSQFGVFIGFVVSGLVLQWGESRSALLPAFAVTFLIAGASRLFSTACLIACREPEGRSDTSPPQAGGLRERIAAPLRVLSRRPAGAIVVFLCWFMFGTQIAAPYFTPYMLRELGFSYHTFMLVYGTSFLSKAVFLPTIGRGASRVGAVRTLWLASLAILPLALLWLPSANVAYLCVVQVLAGACWGSYELAVTLIFFEAIEAKERTAVVTAYNIGIAMATVAGGTFGGLILRSLGEDWQAYATVFVVSCLARLTAIPLLRWTTSRFVISRTA